MARERVRYRFAASWDGTSFNEAPAHGQGKGPALLGVGVVFMMLQ